MLTELLMGFITMDFPGLSWLLLSPEALQLNL